MNSTETISRHFFSSSPPNHALPSKPQYSPYTKSQIVTKGLDIYLQTKKSNEALKWGIINIVLLAFILFDISNKCPFVFSKWFYVEYLAAAILGLSILYHFGKYFYILFNFKPVQGTEEQRRLLQFDEGDASFLVTPVQKSTQNANKMSMSISNLSWHSSFNDSNRTVASPNYVFNRISPSHQLNQQNMQRHSFNHNNNSSFLNASQNSTGTNQSTPFSSPYKNLDKNEIITDEIELQKYLREVSQQEKNSFNNSDSRNDTVDHNSIWNYCNNAASILKTSLYQMSPTSNVSPIQQTTAKDELGMFSSADLDGNSELIKKISLSGQLTQYIYNLRMWIAFTILHRLDKAITKTNAAFAKNSWSDIQIGSVGLDRLKKTSEIQQFVSTYVPMLPMIISFLEFSPNQEYLIKRIRDMAKGCVLADYRWNSGGTYNGISWDEHLPTDSAIIFHLFCTYLDSQLPPIPQPGERPFYSRYVVIGDKKSPKEIIAEAKAKNSKCAILCTNPMKPKFNFISNDKIHNCNQERNNIFYVIIEFLIYMKTHNEGMLDGVNLGRSGINLLKVIGE